jgi:hypothetical protein
MALCLTTYELLIAWDEDEQLVAEKHPALRCYMGVLWSSLPATEQAKLSQIFYQVITENFRPPAVVAA